MKVTRIEPFGEFDPTGRKRSMVGINIYYSHDLKLIRDENVFQRTYRENYEKYHALKEKGIDLDCQSLTYTHNMDKPLPDLDELKAVLVQWEKDVAAVIPHVEKEIAFQERCLAHGLKANINMRVPTPGDYSTRWEGYPSVTLELNLDPLRSCGTSEKPSKYIEQLTGWNNEFCDQETCVPCTNLDHLTDTELDAIARDMATEFNFSHTIRSGLSALNQKVNNINHEIRDSGMRVEVERDGFNNDCSQDSEDGRITVTLKLHKGSVKMEDPKFGPIWKQLYGTERHTFSHDPKQFLSEALLMDMEDVLKNVLKFDMQLFKDEQAKAMKEQKKATAAANKAKKERVAMTQKEWTDFVNKARAKAW